MVGGSVLEKPCLVLLRTLRRFRAGFCSAIPCRICTRKGKRANQLPGWIAVEPWESRKKELAREKGDSALLIMPKLKNRVPPINSLSRILRQFSVLSRSFLAGLLEGHSNRKTRPCYRPISALRIHRHPAESAGPTTLCSGLTGHPVSQSSFFLGRAVTRLTTR